MSKKMTKPKTFTRVDSIEQAAQIRAQEGNSTNPGRKAPRGPLTDSELQAREILKSADWNK